MSSHKLNAAVARFLSIAGAVPALAVLLAAGVLAGCARRYDVTLTNGDHLYNVRKPTLNKQGGYYYIVNGHGQTNFFTASRVVEIEPHQTPKTSKVKSSQQ